MTTADLTRELNTLDSNFESFKKAYLNNPSDWMHRRVEFFSPTTAYDCVSEFRNGVIRINNLIEKLRINNPNLIPLSSPIDYYSAHYTNYYTTDNINYLAYANEERQQALGGTICDNYFSINEDAKRMYNKINPNARKWTRENYEGCDCYVGVSILCSIVALIVLLVYFDSKNR